MVMADIYVDDIGVATTTHCTLRRIFLNKLIARLCEHVYQPSGHIRSMHYPTMDRYLYVGGTYASTFAAEVKITDR